jgi:hypothetical protein
MRAFLICLGLTLLLPLGARTALASSFAGPYALELIDETGNVLPTYWKGGRTYVLGTKGQRYSLRIRNQSGNRVEFVSSVDGRDALDGRPASWDKRGYIVMPWGEVVIDGFRLDHESVAAFRFSSVRDSYASQMGDAREVGVIGVAVFTERQHPQPVRPHPSFERGLLGGAADSSAGPVPPSAAPAQADAISGARLSEALRSKKDRPGLGTEFGEQRASHVDEVAFERASSRPAAQLDVRYDDREGLRAMGVQIDRNPDMREADLRESANPFPSNFCAPPPRWNR